MASTDAAAAASTVTTNAVKSQHAAPSAQRTAVSSQPQQRQQQLQQQAEPRKKGIADEPFVLLCPKGDMHNLVMQNVRTCLLCLQHIAVLGTAADGVILNPGTGAPTAPIPRHLVTVFHSAAAPQMTVEQYAARIATYSTYGADGIAYALVLLGRFVKATQRLPSQLTVHRLLLVCVSVAMKANSDLFYKN